MKPNVLFIIDSFEQGGSERQALQLLRQLHESGEVRVRLACLQNRGSLKAEAEQLGIGEIHEYPLTSFYDLNFAQQLRRFIRHLKENAIDVVHTHCFYTNIFGMTGAFLAGVPARVTSKGETDGFRTPLQKRAERISFRLGQRVIANCLVVQDMLIREGVDPKKIIQHYNGLDLDRLQVSGASRESATVKFNLPAGKRFIKIVSNLRKPVKDHPMFLRAAARVRAAVPDAAFVVAGEGELMPGLRALALELGIPDEVHFIGRGDDEKMADRIIQVLSDDGAARRMGAKGRAMVAGKFSSEQHLRNTLELYQELLHRPAGQARKFQSDNTSTSRRSVADLSLAQALTLGVEEHEQPESFLKEAKN